MIGPDLPPPASRAQRLVVRPLQEFARLEASAGLVLLAATVVALVWANVAAHAYDDLWSAQVTLHLGPLSEVEDLRGVVDEGLMTLFFLVVGLEVKRELAVGELSTRQAALLPAFAAVGGMVLPVLIFLAVTAGAEGAHGWGIPMATDVAFALAALVAVGSRAPAALVAFLLGVAVIDDIGAILVVAVYYTDSIHLAWLVAALVGVALIVALQRMRVASLWPYLALGLVVWLATFESGVHATIAGVALGLLTPVRPFPPSADHGPDAVAPLERVEGRLHGWSSYVVLPVFALANAGIALDADALDAATHTPVALAAGLGLVVGKTIGLTLGAALAVGLGVSALPDGVRWRHVVGVGALAGIGFTVSLFITGLAYSDPALVGASKIGVLGGSVVAALVGFALLAAVARRARLSPGAPRPDPPPPG